MDTHEYRGGFTIVEIVVTVVVLGIFIGIFVQLFQSSASQETQIERQAKASSYAQANLSKFPTAASLDGYTCDTTTGSGNTNNLALNPDANGTQILTDDSDDAEQLPASLIRPTQEVIAYSPTGCSGLIKVVSIIHYGHDDARGEAIHAAYVK